MTSLSVFTTAVDEGSLAAAARRHKKLLANNMQLLLAVALEGGGIAYGPSFIFGEALCRGALVRVLPRYSAADLGIYTLVPSSRYLSTKVRHLVDQLATEFGENPPWDRWRKATSSPMK